MNKLREKILHSSAEEIAHVINLEGQFTARRKNWIPIDGYNSQWRRDILTIRIDGENIIIEFSSVNEWGKDITDFHSQWIYDPIKNLLSPYREYREWDPIKKILSPDGRGGYREWHTPKERVYYKEYPQWILSDNITADLSDLIDLIASEIREVYKYIED